MPKPSAQVKQPVDLGFAIKFPPRRAIAYFKAKGYDISWNWWEVWQEAQAKAFTVAKATRMDVLGSIRGEIDKALAQGTTERAFLKTMEPRLQKLGWWGRQVHVDKDGQAETVQLGSPHRLKTIYRTNMHTARAAGRYQQQTDSAEDRPYWQYDALDDGRARASHVAMNGLVFRHNDPIWDTHYPPNGFNCRCRVRALTAEQVKDKGLKISSGQGKLKAVEQTVGVDKRTGEVIIRQGTAYRFVGPDGKPQTLLPDPGWNYNPGKRAALFDQPGGGGALSKLVAGQKTYQGFGLPSLDQTPARLRLPAPPRLPKADNLTQALEQLAQTLAIPKRGWRRIKTPAGLDDVIIRKEALAHIVEQGKGHREQFAHYILPTLEDPLEVWLAEHEITTPSGKTQKGFRRRFIALFQEEGKKSRGGLAVIQENKDESLLWTFIPAQPKGYLDQQRQGFLLYRKQGGQ